MSTSVPGADRAPLVPMPADWSGPRRALPAWMLALLCVFAAMGGWLVVHAVVSSAGGLDTAVGVLVLVMSGAMAAIGVRDRRWPGRRTPVVELADGRGLRFPYSRLLTWVSGGALLLLLLVFGWTLIHHGRLWITDGPTTDVVLWAVIGGFFTAWALVQLAYVVTGRLRRGAVLVTTDGVTVRHWSGDAHITWADLAAVFPNQLRGHPVLHLSGRPWAKPTYVTRARFFGYDDTRLAPSIPVRVTLLEGDPALMAHAVAWYLIHPEARGELADSTAQQRVLAGRAVVPNLDDSHGLA